MKITRIYSSKDGESHFEELPDLQFFNVNGLGKLSNAIQINAMRIHEFHNNIFQDWHTPSFGHTYVIILEGIQEIETSEGIKRTFSYGDILSIEDVSGRGHRTRVLQSGKSVILTVSDSKDI